MDTQPPLFYLTEASKQIIWLVNQFNLTFGNNQRHLAAYTFDAGPNAFLFVEDHALGELLYVLYRLYFEQEHEMSAFARQCVLASDSSQHLIDLTRLSSSAERKQQLDEFCHVQRQYTATAAAVVKRIIHSKVGDEPRVYDNMDKFSLL